ncbi:MAG TPA: hypothetical protein VK327_10935, partial [Candidatus Paceibacterota bacterium]|nr:hypothetical protein [Candidatus Paceibacterota bacterium]
MKIVCQCGAKFAVDVTPEMATRPVQFICPSCGLDSSSAVNELIQQELAQNAPEEAAAVVVAESPAPRKHVTLAGKTHASPASSDVSLQVCLKHPGQPVQHQCLVCKKPMCSKCMELFGYVCSPF